MSAVEKIKLLKGLKEKLFQEFNDDELVNLIIMKLSIQKNL